MASCSTEQPSPSNVLSISRLDEAANFLMLVSDGEAGIENTCGLTSDNALAMMEPVHALIDEEMRKNTYRMTSKLESTCEVRCHCGLYSDLSISTHIKNDLLKKAQSLSKQQLVTCANETAKWFCKDTLLPELQKAAAEMVAPAQ
jgi:hypothetical protein